MNEGNVGEPISAGAYLGARPPDELTLRFEQGIDLLRIRALLAQARERAGAPAESVLTLNLVAIHFSPNSYQRGRAGLEAAGVLHPARMVVLIADTKGAAEGVSARVSVIRPPGAGQVIERIVLTAGGAAARHLESAMLGLLIPEVPFVVVWGGRAEGPLLTRAVEAADRVIIDSRTRPPQALVDVAWLLQRGAPLGDLSWARIFPWQSLAAEVLDLPDLREHRGNLESARIVCVGEPGPEGALLAGWFQSRVKRAKVELVAGPIERAETHTAEHEGPIAAIGKSQDAPAPPASNSALPPPPEPLGPGQVCELHFEAPPAHFLLSREKGLLLAQVRGDDDGEVVHRVRLPPDRPGRLLAMELKLLAGRDDIYASAVDAAARLVASRVGK